MNARSAVSTWNSEALSMSRWLDVYWQMIDNRKKHRTKWTNYKNWALFIASWSTFRSSHQLNEFTNITKLSDPRFLRFVYFWCATSQKIKNVCIDASLPIIDNIFRIETNEIRSLSMTCYTYAKNDRRWGVVSCKRKKMIFPLGDDLLSENQEIFHRIDVMTCSAVQILVIYSSVSMTREHRDELPNTKLMPDRLECIIRYFAWNSVR